MDEPIRLALVDDSPEFRSELARVFERLPGFELVDSCADAGEAIARLPGAAPQLVFVDLNLPGRSGVELVTELRRLLPGARRLILTIEHDGRRLIEPAREDVWRAARRACSRCHRGRIRGGGTWISAVRDSG